MVKSVYRNKSEGHGKHSNVRSLRTFIFRKLDVIHLLTSVYVCVFFVFTLLSYVPYLVTNRTQTTDKRKLVVTEPPFPRLLSKEHPAPETS